MVTAPSNANTSGLGDMGLSETYRFAYESIRNGAPGLSDATCAAIARSINMKASLAANANAAKITELEDELSQANANGASHWSRATAAESRADRLALALEWVIHMRSEMIGVPVDTEAANAWAVTLDAAADYARAALQQETQP